MTSIRVCDTQGDEVHIHPSLPVGLLYFNDTITGTPILESPLMQYFISTDKANGSFWLAGCFFFLLSYLVTTNLYKASVGFTRGYIPINQTFSPIHIFTDAEVDTISVTPSLPSGLWIDPVTRVLSGVYTGGSILETYVLDIRNSYGRIQTSFQVFYTGM